LVGAPPGYVGYEEGGQLTEKIRRKPYSVILLDEIEKANPRIWNLFLQIFDDGRATDGQGHVVNFKETIFMMTSNVGSNKIKDYKHFGRHEEEEMIKAAYQTFPPEFMNRIDEVVVFHPLSRNEIEQILDLSIKRMNHELSDRNISIVLSPKLRDYIANHGYVPEMGARPMKRLITSLVQDPISFFLLQRDYSGKLTLDLEYKDVMPTGVIMVD
jgi:ATP-dependent Clp protease ATP-binding subunit ClpA